MNKKLQLNICFCGDEFAVKKYITVINSIQKKNSHHTINIHFIRPFDSCEDYEELKKHVASFDNLDLFEYHKTWESNYDGMEHIESSATMIRLYIPELLNVDKVIYLDMDLIVNMDLQTLYEIDCEEHGIAMANHLETPRHERRKLGLGKKLSGNAGVMVLDLNRLRENDFTNKCLDFNKTHGGNDQHAINWYCRGTHKILEVKYNLFYADNGYLINTLDDYIFHWAGPYKPWHDKIDKYDFLWE